MSNSDRLYRYIFKDVAVRGELVKVNETFQTILSHHNYPPTVQKLLGELLVVTSLLTATIKVDCNITVQLQGDGPLALAVVHANNKQQMSAVARVNGTIPDQIDFEQLCGTGYLAITIIPIDGERYQGIVSLEGDSITECVERYFIQSEQLATRLFIHTNMDENNLSAAGMFLQILPSAADDLEAFNHLATLTETITADELFTLNIKEILHRLYHQENIELFEAQQVSFHCNCSRERCFNSLRMVSMKELQQILEEEKQIDIQCEFCGQHYLFDAVDIASLNIEQNISPISNNLH